jgi:hypothetical protein
MATVELSGHSDDLAEIEGDFLDEFDADIYAKGRFIFDTGTQIELSSNAAGSWVLKNVTPPNVLNDDEIEITKKQNGDGLCTVTGDFNEIAWAKDYKTARRRSF